jgi:WXG100 family type VII secretion target
MSQAEKAIVMAGAAATSGTGNPSPIDSQRLLVGEELSQAGGYINNAAQQIVDELNKLYAQLQPLFDTWTGPAASYFDPLMAEWQFAAKGLFGTAAEGGVLGEIAAAMHVSWNNYAEAENANASTWTSAGS